MSEKVQRTDPFTVEIVLDGLRAAAKEMFVTLGRTAKSPIIYEVLDYACGLYSPGGELVAQDNGVTGFLGTLYFAVREAREKFGGSMADGDVYITNDPWTGNGSHLSDVNLVMPVFLDGEIIAYAVNKAHWTEIGGRDPGSWSATTTDVYQEGLQFPCVRLYRAGAIDQSLLDVIRANVRTPDDTLGDMYAQAAALKAGAHRVVEIARKFGRDALIESMAIHVRRGEEIACRALGGLPKGSFEVHDVMENNALTGEPVPVHLRLTIDDEHFIVDVSGNRGPFATSINGTAVGVAAQARTVFKMVSDPHSPVSEGNFLPVEVDAPEGTIFSAPRPAAVSIHWEYKTLLTDMIFQILAPHLPDRLTAGHQLSVCGTIVSGQNVDGSYWLLVEPQLGGWGAATDRDGLEGQHPVGNGETYNVPIEVLETRYPIQVEEYRFDTGHGHGAGRFRGGSGVVRSYRVLSPSGAAVTATFGRHHRAPWGTMGGADGSPNRIEILDADGVVRRSTGTLSREPLAQGWVVRFVTATGGGWGPPLERDPERVLQDYLDGYVTAEIARDLYGVVIDKATGTVDAFQTGRLRGSDARG